MFGNIISMKCIAKAHAFFYVLTTFFSIKKAGCWIDGSSKKKTGKSVCSSILLTETYSRHMRLGTRRITFLAGKRRTTIEEGETRRKLIRNGLLKSQSCGRLFRNSFVFLIQQTESSGKASATSPARDCSRTCVLSRRKIY